MSGRQLEVYATQNGRSLQNGDISQYCDDCVLTKNGITTAGSGNEILQTLHCRIKGLIHASKVLLVLVSEKQYTFHVEINCIKQ
jgi:hypothetical protein